LVNYRQSFVRRHEFLSPPYAASEPSDGRVATVGSRMTPGFCSEATWVGDLEHTVRPADCWKMALTSKTATPG